MRDPMIESLRGARFSGGSIQTGLASNKPHTQLWNPALSGVTLILEQIRVADSGWSAEMFINSHNAALGSLEATVGNHLLAGAAPGGEVRRQNNTTFIGTTIDTYFHQQAATDFWDFLSRPYVIPPGRGLIVAANLNAVTLRVGFSWREVSA